MLRSIAWRRLTRQLRAASFKSPKRQSGIEAAYRLRLLLKNPEYTPTQLVLAVSLVERATTERR
jgi:hypothetical protein